MKRKPQVVYFPKGYALTSKQKLFCDYYLETLDGYNAAIKAGYSHARAIAHEKTIMQLPKVAEYIRLHVDAIKEKERVKHNQDIDRFQRNVEKLDYIIDKTITDDENVSLEGFDKGMKAIDLQAKLFGHYAPTKTANLNVNINKDEVQEAKTLLHKLIQDNTKDY